MQQCFQSGGTFVEDKNDATVRPVSTQNQCRVHILEEPMLVPAAMTVAKQCPASKVCLGKKAVGRSWLDGQGDLQSRSLRNPFTGWLSGSCVVICNITDCCMSWSQPSALVPCDTPCNKNNMQPHRRQSFCQDDQPRQSQMCWPT